MARPLSEAQPGRTPRFRHTLVLSQDSALSFFSNPALCIGKPSLQQHLRIWEMGVQGYKLPWRNKSGVGEVPSQGCLGAPESLSQLYHYPAPKDLGEGLWDTKFISK